MAAVDEGSGGGLSLTGARPSAAHKRILNRLAGLCVRRDGGWAYATIGQRSAARRAAESPRRACSLSGVGGSGAFDVTVTSPEVIFFSADVERASSFYKALGFTETFRVPAKGTPIHVDLQLDGYRIGFASMDSSRKDHGLDPVSDGQRATLTLWTADTEAVYRSLTAAGVTGLAEPRRWLDRLLIAWVADPDGHAIQLAQALDQE